MKRALAVALLLTACDDGDNERFQPPKTDPQAVTSWEIGPGKYSLGMPPHPTKHPEGWSFDLGPDAEPHYITTAGSLAGKSKITLHFRIEAEPGTVIFPKDMSGLPSQLALYFQRRGDDWSGAGKFEAYRWYSAKRIMPITPGEHELTVSLAEGWGAVRVSTNANNPTAFGAAIADVCRVGFVMGGGNSGVGHGVRATAPARFIATKFAAE